MVRFLLISTVCVLASGCAVNAGSADEAVASSEEAMTIGYAWPSCFNIAGATLDPEAENDGAYSGYKTGCVSHRVELNVPSGPDGSWASEEIVAQFPEHTGAWTHENINNCRNSFVRVWYAEKAQSSTATYSTIKSVDVPAEVDFHADGYNYYIEGCRAKWNRATCTGWNVTNDVDYVRVDAVTFSNGVRSSNPVSSSIKKYDSCGGL